MLTPFQFSVVTVAEAKILIDFIEKSTATKAYPKNYDKMQKMGILEIYNSLDNFVCEYQHYEDKLRYLESD